MNMKRIYAGGIDFLITCLIQTLLMAMFLIRPLLGNMESIDVFSIMVRQLTITYCSMTFMVVRDIIGKKSIGKIIFKQKIIDKNNGNEIKFVKRFLRNITWLLGPIDIIIFLVSKNRLGDIIAGTSVIDEG